MTLVTLEKRYSLAQLKTNLAVPKPSVGFSGDRWPYHPACTLSYRTISPIVIRTFMARRFQHCVKRAVDHSILSSWHSNSMPAFIGGTRDHACSHIILTLQIHASDA